MRGRPCGRKRSILVDRLGLPWSVVVTSANTSDNEAGRKAVDRLKGKVPRLEVIAADHGYKVSFIEHVEKEHDWVVEIAQKPASTQGFVPEKNRWPVERSFGWLNFRPGPPVRSVVSGCGENHRKFGSHASDCFHFYCYQQVRQIIYQNKL